MVIEEAIYSLLSGTAALTALVGKKIYPQVLPQNIELPAITFSKVSSNKIHTFKADTGFVVDRFQFSMWGKTFASANAVSVQVREAIHDYSGTMGGTGGVPVSGVLAENELTLYDSETATHQIIQDYMIFHTE